MNRFEYMPSNGITRNQIPEKLCDIAQSVRLVAVNSHVICFKRSLEKFLPVPIEIAKSFGHESVESRERAFLGTTFDNHVDQFHFLSFLEIDLHEFVAAFFVVYGGHDCQVDCSTEIDDVGVCFVLDLDLSLLIYY